MLKVFWCILRRDLVLAARRRAEALATLFFFLLVAALYPLAIGPEPELLRTLAPGAVWVAALVASVLGLGRLFGPDLADGTLEQMLLSAEPLPVIVGAKLAAHWLLTGLPLVLLSPLLALQYGLAPAATLALACSLLLGTPLLALLGAIGAALTLNLRGGGVLLALLVLPWYVPVLVFGAGAVEAQAGGQGAGAHWLLLGAGLAAALALAPWATALALRIALE
ncbi:MAG: heme exporter protein CcmB [Noviherbaspirillum sp.]